MKFDEATRTRLSVLMKLERQGGFTLVNQERVARKQA